MSGELAAAFTAEVVEALEPLRDERLVITGGTGFMGTWLAEAACHLNDTHGFGIRIDLLARHASASPPAGRADVTVHDRDVRDVAEFPRDTSFVVHAAGTPDNRVHASDPVRTIQTFVHGTEAVLWAAARLERLQRLLHVSSGLVHSSHDFTGVLATYPEAKRMGETLCAAYRSQHRVPIVTARPFAFIGPHQALTAPWAVNNFIQDGLHGGPIRILGNPETVRSYMYPTDMAVWLLSALVRGREGHAYDVGSEHGVTLGELAQRIAAQLPGAVEVVHGGRGARPGAASEFVPDVSAAHDDLGVSETVDLNDAIRRTLAWHRGPAPALRAVSAA